MTDFIRIYERTKDRELMCVSKDGLAVHIHRFWPPDEYGRFMGGIEFHRTPPAGVAARHDHCRFLNGPCNPDGSSLWFYEEWGPRWSVNEGDMEYMFRALEGEHSRQMREQEDA